MISRDLWTSGDRKPMALEIVDLIYMYEGVVAWAFYVSGDFARDHQLKAGVAPLPDEPGEWARQLDCCCSKCFREAHDGDFDKDFRWRSNAK